MTNGRALRILYAGALYEGGTCLQRLKVLQELGHQVVPFDFDSHLAGAPRVVDSIRFRLSWGPGVERLNREFTRLGLEVRPDLVWVDKGLFVRPGSLDAVKVSTGAFLVHYNPDDPFGAYRRGWRVFLRAIPFYDLHFVPREVNKEEYLRTGARQVERFYWAFDPGTHRAHSVSAEERERLGGAVGFIGGWEAERSESLRFLVGQGVPVRIWGTNWHKCRSAPHGMRIEPGPLYGRDYSRGICSFDINLGFLRKGNRDLSTTRSVEVPACGAFMLAERTIEHCAMFEEGKEAEFFATDRELVDKVRYYLARPDDRRRIAQAGRQRCLHGGYSNQDRLRQMLSVIEAVREARFGAGADIAFRLDPA